MMVKKFNHKRIVQLRAEGLTIRAIAKQMKCSRGAVEYALRLANPKPEGRELCLWRQGA